MVSLQVFVGQRGNIGIQKQQHKNQAPRATTEKEVGVDLGPEGGMDSAWNFPGRENQDKFDHDKGQKSAISGRRLHWIFCFFSSIYVEFSKTSPLKSGESSQKSSGENCVKSCHVCGCHGFFGPEKKRLNKIGAISGQNS